MLLLLRMELLHLLKVLELLELRRSFRVHYSPSLEQILVILRFLRELLGDSTHFFGAWSDLRGLEEHRSRVCCDGSDRGRICPRGDSCHVRTQRRVYV